MCADIHDGREQTLPSKGRIQMRETNYLQITQIGLQRTAGPYRCANIRRRLQHNIQLVGSEITCLRLIGGVDRADRRKFIA